MQGQELGKLLDEYSKKVGWWPKSRRPKGEGGDKPGEFRNVSIINRYFGTEFGEVIVEEADRAGLVLEAACTLVEQESNGCNIFGCDRINGVPHFLCHQPVTKARISRLKANGYGRGMNGVGLTQLAYYTFVEEAEKLGGAHISKNQLQVGFDLLGTYFTKYGGLDGYGAYNAGESNRASVRGTYSASCIVAQRVGSEAEMTIARRSSLRRIEQGCPESRFTLCDTLGHYNAGYLQPYRAYDAE